MEPKTEILLKQDYVNYHMALMEPTEKSNRKLS
jgi:hypothetical protein